MINAAFGQIDSLTYEVDGAERRPGVLDRASVGQLDRALSSQPTERAGVRLFGAEAVRPLLARSGPVGRLAVSVLGEAARPVRAILFDKTPTTNWALGWHQDRVIAVAERRQVDGYGPWTRKAGVWHVAPPFDILAAMVTIRVHMDAISETNAPLLIAPGSHRLGRVPDKDAAAAAKQCGVATCLAAPGDAWLYATPILHASDAAAAPRRRRVLQVDYAAIDLSGGLRWIGV